MGRITLRCSACGNEMEMSHKDDPSIPEAVVKIVHNECPKCEAASGGYGQEDWYDEHGNIVVPE